MVLMQGYRTDVDVSGLKDKLMAAGMKDFNRTMDRAEKLLVCLVMGDTETSTGKARGLGSLSDKAAMLILSKAKADGYKGSNRSLTEKQKDAKREKDSKARDVAKVKDDKVLKALKVRLAKSGKLKAADSKKLLNDIAAFWLVEIK